MAAKDLNMDFLLGRPEDVTSRPAQFIGNATAGVCRSLSGLNLSSNLRELKNMLLCLSQELVELRRQDQSLYQQLMALHTVIRDLKEKPDRDESDPESDNETHCASRHLDNGDKSSQRHSRHSTVRLAVARSNSLP